MENSRAALGHCWRGRWRIAELRSGTTGSVGITGSFGGRVLRVAETRRMAAENEKIVKSEDEWRKDLTPERYRVLREAATERAFTGALLHNEKTGTYSCAACGRDLFTSDVKYDSGSGWPSFYDAID